MNTKMSLALLAIVIASVPASAQISTSDRVRDRVILGDRRADPRTGGGVGDIIFGRSEEQRAESRRGIPRGHLPPAGSCRIWVDGVPPGHQPPVMSCADAERERVRYGANARVVYGDRDAFPGKGKGKFKNRDRTDTDIFGRRVDVDDDDDDDDDRWDDDDDDDRRKSGKAQKSGKAGKVRGKGGRKG